MAGWDKGRGKGKEGKGEGRQREKGREEPSMQLPGVPGWSCCHSSTLGGWLTTYPWTEVQPAETWTWTDMKLGNGREIKVNEGLKQQCVLTSAK